MLSIVIPVFNEEDNIFPVIESLEEALRQLDYEVVFVDDGSSDHTVKRILESGRTNIKLVEFARNYGQTSAMAAGIDVASGEFIATIDGDLQNDPSDIIMMLNKLRDENLDVVAGRRMNRQDGFILRKIPSKLANFLIRRMTKIKIRDYGCTLKIFRTSLAKKLDLYGELHRFIPILAVMHGAKIAEVEVKHHARKFGKSKYGLGRTTRVFSDLLLMVFFLKYWQKPMHLFGTLGIITGASSIIINIYLAIEKIIGNDIGNRPLFYIGILLIIASIQFITTGFLAELLMRIYHNSSKNKKPYDIAAIYQNGKEVDK